jgi:hypothetical protein
LPTRWDWSRDATVLFTPKGSDDVFWGFVNADEYTIYTDVSDDCWGAGSIAAIAPALSRIDTDALDAMRTLSTLDREGGGE